MLARKFAGLWPYLDERQRRLWLGVEARQIGHGGISAVARAAGVSWPTVSKAVKELDQPSEPELVVGRARRPGGGRKPLSVRDPGLVPALEALIDPDTRGDPGSPLRWTCKSTRRLADELTAQGHPVSHSTVGDLLHGMGYSLQANAKTREGNQHPDHDVQFAYLSDQAAAFLDAGDPVVSVDAKKNELAGDYKNNGRQWQPESEPVEVNTHDFPGEAGKAIPYGIYDIAANTGWVAVGTDHDTASFAVATLRRWWDGVGKTVYPHARRLLICADGGGSNS